MQDEFMQTIEVITSLNNSCKKRVLSQAEIDEQMENLNDFQSMVVELKKILFDFKTCHSMSVDETVELLLQLHLKFSDYIWHVDQLHELVKKMAGNYRDSV